MRALFDNHRRKKTPPVRGGIPEKFLMMYRVLIKKKFYHISYVLSKLPVYYVV